MLRIRPMTVDELSLGMRLKEQAGWNQVEADWRRFLAMQPDGCFVAELDGTPVGTAVGCMFGSVAWVAMVLVDVAVRGRGIGKALVEHALTFVEGQGATSVRLDATSLGQPLYEKLGFVPQYELRRYAGALSGRRRRDSAVRAAQADDYDSIFALDRSVTNTDRRKFLVRVFEERPCDVRVHQTNGQTDGYLAVRPGSLALQLGPCIASPDAGELLLTDACGRFAAQRVFLDVPSANHLAVQFAESARLDVQRTFTRMCRRAQIADDLTRLWASSGPELG